MFERIVEFSPAYDKRHSDPAKNHGIGAVTIRFVLKGAIGAVQFVIGTTWYLPHNQRTNREWQYNYDTKFDHIQPTGWDLGYHADSKHPIREFHKEIAVNEDDYITRAMDCQYVESGKCYYDGSGLNAEPLVEILLREGDAGIWKELEEYYRNTFGQDE